jgi:competence protein ComEC
MGLLAIHDVWSRWLARRDETDHGVVHHVAGVLLRMLCVAVLTSLAAGGLSSIAAAYHFGRLAPYSLIANLLALPVMSILVMPPALFAVLAMPFGLEALPLQMMDAGLVLVQAISDWVVSLPGAQGRIPALPLAPALLLTLAAIILCLTKGWARSAAFPIAVVALLATTLNHRPEIYVDQAAKNVAIRNDSGELVPAQPRRGRFAVSQWLRADGDDAIPAAAARRAGWQCEEAICRAAVKGQRVVYLSDEKLAMEIPCADADILIAAFPLRGRCRSVPLRIDRFSVWRSGAHALRIDDGVIRIETARGQQGLRPWTMIPEPRRKDTSRTSGQDALLRP